MMMTMIDGAVKKRAKKKSFVDGRGPLVTTDRRAATERNQESSVVSRIKKDCLSFAASLQEGCSYVKALLVGQVNKITAKSEKEAAEANLQTAKMQVEAADAAEDTKKKLDRSM